MSPFDSNKVTSRNVFVELLEESLPTSRIIVNAAVDPYRGMQLAAPFDYAGLVLGLAPARLARTSKRIAKS